MAPCYWPDVEKGQHRARLQQLEGGDVAWGQHWPCSLSALDYLAEQAGGVDLDCHGG